MGEVREVRPGEVVAHLQISADRIGGEGEYQRVRAYAAYVHQTEGRLADADKELARLHAEVAQLREERDRYRAALERIATMPNELLLSDAATSDQMADRAYTALTPTGGDHE